MLVYMIYIQSTVLLIFMYGMLLSIQSVSLQSFDITGGVTESCSNNKLMVLPRVILEYLCG